MGIRAILISAAGAAAAGALAWHFTPLVGPAAQLKAKSDALHTASAQLLAAGIQLTHAAAAITARDRQLVENAKGEAGDGAQTADFWSGQCRSAWSAGYAARQCPGGDAAGVVRDDLGTIWDRGRYAGAAGPAVEPDA